MVCEPRDEGPEPDSGVHRYDRVHGFAVTGEELAMMWRNPVIAAAERHSRQADNKTRTCRVSAGGPSSSGTSSRSTRASRTRVSSSRLKCRRLALQTDMEDLARDAVQRLRMDRTACCVCHTCACEICSYILLYCVTICWSSAHANFGDVYPGGRGGTSKEDISILKYKKNCNWYGQKRKYCVHA